ncbi:hypothetical protein BD311DRAFT_767895, partial [Dichomitus squalens]
TSVYVGVNPARNRHEFAHCKKGMCQLPGSIGICFKTQLDDGAVCVQASLSTQDRKIFKDVGRLGMEDRETDRGEFLEQGHRRRQVTIPSKDRKHQRIRHSHFHGRPKGQLTSSEEDGEGGVSVAESRDVPQMASVGGDETRDILVRPGDVAKNHDDARSSLPTPSTTY